nr:bZIP transcription factor 17-like isoform X1 [Ipomoea batatas]
MNSVVADPSTPPSSNVAVIGTISMDDLGDPLPFLPMDPDYFSFDDFDLPFNVTLKHGAIHVDHACYFQHELQNHSPPELSLSSSRVLNSDLFELHPIDRDLSGNLNTLSPESNVSRTKQPRELAGVVDSPRTENTVVDTLAGISKGAEKGMHLLDDPPIEVVGCLAEDAAGFPRWRNIYVNV